MRAVSVAALIIIVRDFRNRPLSRLVDYRVGLSSCLCCVDVLVGLSSYLCCVDVLVSLCCVDVIIGLSSCVVFMSSQAYLSVCVVSTSS